MLRRRKIIRNVNGDIILPSWFVSVLLGVILSALIAGWGWTISTDVVQSKDIEFGKATQAAQTSQLNRIESKLDRLVERNPK